MTLTFGNSKIFFIGAGPGDVELLTVKAMKTLQASNVVFYAGSLVNRDMLAIIKTDARLIDMKSLTYEEIRDETLKALSVINPINVSNEDNIISILHAGDSSIYSSINEQMAYLDEIGVDYEIIPGVTAAFAASAKNKSILTLPEISQAVIFCRGEGRTGGVPKGQDIKSLASHRATMAIYLSFGIIESVVEDLSEYYDLSTPCLIAKSVSQDGEMLINCELKDVIAESKKNFIKNMAILIIGEAIRGKTYKDIRSKLYDKNFSHAFRG